MPFFQLGTTGRIPAHDLECDRSEAILDLIDPMEILFGYNATAADNGLFYVSSRLAYAHKKHLIYLYTTAGTFETEYRGIDEILRDLGDNFIRANHGLFVNYKKILWLGPLGVGYHAAGFSRSQKCSGKYDEWIRLSRMQGRVIYDLILSGG
jgi:hypothetical protein